MSARYTSPELSRQLAEAGLEQGLGGTMCYDADDGSLVQQECADAGSVRALDLTDVLAELTRPRPEEKDVRPLCEKVYVLTPDSGRLWTCVGVRPDEEVIDHDVEINGDAGESSVDVAATVLLALLRERKP